MHPCRWHHPLVSNFYVAIISWQFTPRLCMHAFCTILNDDSEKEDVWRAEGEEYILKSVGQGPEIQ